MSPAGFLLAIGAWLLLPFLVVPSARAQEITPPLRLTRDLGPCEKHVYRVRMGARETLRGSVEQDGVSVRVSARRFDGAVASEPFDVEPQVGGRERFLILSEAPAEYEVWIEAENHRTGGQYVLAVQNLAPTSDRDLLELSGEHLLRSVKAKPTYQYGEWSRQQLLQARNACRAAGAIECEADALQLLGHERWFASQDVPAARAYLLESLALVEQSGDRYSQGDVLNDLGVVTRFLGELTEARDYYERALALRTASNMQEDPLILHHLSTVYWPLGELQRALDLERKAIAIWLDIGDMAGAAYGYSWMGQLALNLNDPANALHYQQQALRIWKSSNHLSGIAASTMRLGAIAESTGDRRAAIKNYREARQLSREIGYPLGEGEALIRLGDALLSIGDVNNGKQAFEQALEIFRAGKLDETAALKGLGDVSAAVGDQAAALDFYQKVRTISEQTGDAQRGLDAVLAIARIDRDRGNLNESRRSLEKTTDLLESLRVRLSSPELRASYLAARQSHYDLMIDVLMRIARKEAREELQREAFEVSERARARGLLDSLAFARVDVSGADAQLVAEEEALRHRLNGKASTLARMNAAQRQSAIGSAMRKEIELLTLRYRDVRRSLSRVGEGVSAPPLTTREIQSLLDRDTALLEYALGESRSYLWVLTARSLESFVLPPRKEIDEQARRVAELLPLSSRRESSGQARLAAQRLAMSILAPARNVIRGKRLVIVADGTLQFVSFAALPDPNAKEHPLIRGHEIATLPSASLISTLRKRRERVPTLAMAVIADPVVAGDDPRLPGRSPATERPADLTRALGAFDGGFSRLPFTSAEARRIASLVPASQRLRATDFEANRALATGGDLSKYRMLHFATHGLLNADQPELSGLVLSLYDKNGNPQDGFLRLSDVYKLDLSADLVVLSACRTALGQEVKREGLVGLTRGFMYAGVPRVVASLWDVRDAATAELMYRFYRHMLREKMRPAAALRAAQLSMLDEPRWSAPYYWGAFVLQGDWE